MSTRRLGLTYHFTMGEYSLTEEEQEALPTGTLTEIEVVGVMNIYWVISNEELFCARQIFLASKK
jgi:hypothetical protein